MIDLLAESLAPTWAEIFAAIGSVTAIILVLLGWLHFRLNDVVSENKADHLNIQKMESQGRREISSAATAGDKDIYRALGDQYVQKGEMIAQIQTIHTSIEANIQGLTNRVGDFVMLMQSNFKKMDELTEKTNQTSERVSRVEAECRVRHKNPTP